MDKVKWETGKKLNAVEILDVLTGGDPCVKSEREVRTSLERKTMMAAITMLMLDNFYTEKLANKDKCENEAEMFLCRMAGAAKAWLIDLT